MCPWLLLRKIRRREGTTAGTERPPPALLPSPSLLPHRYCLGSLGDLTISGSPTLLTGPLRPSSSDSSAPRRATRPLSPKSCPLGCRSGQLQVDFALFLPGMVRIGKGLVAAESSHRPRASILHSAASSRPASHHNFLLVAQTAATVTLLSIHHQAGASGIPLAKTHLLLQLLLLLSVPEAVAAGGSAAAAGGGTGLNPSPNPVSLTPTSLIPTPSWPSMTQLILANNKARHQSRARNQPMGTGNKKNQRARAEFSEHPASSSKPGVGGARKKRRREWRGGRREEGARKVAQSL